MSTGIDSGQHQDIRAYFNFAGDTRKRSTSRTSEFATTPFGGLTQEEPDKPFHTSSRITMAQTQRTRYVKASAIIGVLLLVIFWLSPSKPSVGSFHSQGQQQQQQQQQGTFYCYLFFFFFFFPLILPNKGKNMRTNRQRLQTSFSLLRLPGRRNVRNPMIRRNL